jgi:predicted alpha/beta superfamily hydrolase
MSMVPGVVLGRSYRALMTDRLSELGGAEVHDLWSPQVGDTFRVFVGHCGAEPQATIVVTDGNALFGLTVDVVRLMQIPGLLPPLTVVAVGYPDAQTVADTIDIRNRDLTPTPWPVFPGSGGADRFLDFIRSTLFDWVSGRFAAAAETPVYFGHSLGGLFGTYALLDRQPPFSHFILSSPSLYWDRYLVFDREAGWSASPPDRDLKAFFGIGGLETDEGRRLEGRDLPEGHRWKPPATYLDMVDDLLRFTEQLRARRHPRLDLAVEVYPDEYHATVPALVLAHGLRRFFSGR